MEFSVRVSVCSSSGASSMTLPSASFGFFLGREVHGDRVADIIGILLDQALEGHLVGVVFFAVITVEVLAQAEDDRRAVFSVSDILPGCIHHRLWIPIYKLFFAALRVTTVTLSATIKAE